MGWLVGVLGALLLFVAFAAMAPAEETSPCTGTSGGATDELCEACPLLADGHAGGIESCGVKR